LVLLGVNLTSIIKNINTVKNTYSSQTIGQVESLFHIYSGRLIQNYQRGLGLFIDTEETSSNKAKNLHFFTADGSSYDAVLSMSSGQVAALTLAFFLSLNRKYANTAFILIDDPTQCMDEINIASLSDLLRIELRDRQVIISTHEQEVSDYLRYRYLRGGLKADSIHLQNKYVETLTEKTK
jgi:exonuclease SbcC